MRALYSSHDICKDNLRSCDETHYFSSLIRASTRKG